MKYNRFAFVLARTLPFVLLTSCASQVIQPAAMDGQHDVFPQPTIVHVHADAPKGLASSTIPVSKVHGEALRQWAGQQARLSALAAPLLLKNADICKPKIHTVSGVTAKTRYSYSSQLAGLAQRELGLGERLQIVSLMPGSGAEKIGLKRGDILLQAGNHKLPSGPGAEHNSEKLINSLVQGRSSLKLSILRGNDQLLFDVPLMPACAVRIELGDSDHVNSYTDGKRVLITRGMLNYAQSDLELTYAIAKEIAHGILMKSTRPDMQAKIDSLRMPGAKESAPHNAGAIKPYLPVMDATADKLALYMLARAGHDIDGVLPFWKRLAKDYPAALPNSHTALHPSTNYRFSVMTAVTNVIKHAQQHKWPLIPN